MFIFTKRLIKNGAKKMNQNDRDYAEYFARQEEEYLKETTDKVWDMTILSFIEFRRIYGNK